MSIESTETEEIEQAVEESIEDKPITASDFALLFELENLAVVGRPATFDLLKSILGDRKVELLPAVFSRYCLYSSPAQYIPELLEVLDAKKLSADKVIDDLESGLARFYSSKQAVLCAGLKSLFEQALKADVPVAGLSLLSSDAAEALMAKLGLSDMDIELFSFEEVGDEVCPRADTWMKVAKSMSKESRRCVALVSSAASCKAAMSAGMRCVVVPDDFTVFQDFSGAEMVIDSFEDCDPEKLVADLFCKRGR